MVDKKYVFLGIFNDLQLTLHSMQKESQYQFKVLLRIFLFKKKLIKTALIIELNLRNLS